MTLQGLQPPQSKQVDGWISNLVGALTEPIIVFPSGRPEKADPARTPDYEHEGRTRGERRAGR